MSNSGWRKIKSKWCQACGMEEAGEVHHIIARMDNGGNEEENLIDLCWLCHIYAPNGYDEIEDYVKNKGFRGSIINNAVLYTTLMLSENKNLKDNFYKNIGGQAGLSKIVRDVTRFYRDNLRNRIKREHMTRGEQLGRIIAEARAK